MFSGIFNRVLSRRLSVTFLKRSFGSSSKDRRSSNYVKNLGFYTLGVGSVLGIGYYMYCRSKKMAIQCAEKRHSIQVLPHKEACRSNAKDVEQVINHCREILTRLKEETGAPGFVVGVSVDGYPIWQEGLGWSDMENRVPCTKDTVMRIASISKSITMAAVAKLWEEGKLDLDKPVQEYVPSFPQKTVDGKKVTLTTRHLVSHLGGIRHYDKSVLNKDKKEDKEKCEAKAPDEKYEEFYLKKEFKSVEEALELFKNDDLLSKPGEKYYYTTHGFTLVSAVVESAAKVSFTVHLKNMLQKLGMEHTRLDEHVPIIYNRARYYQKVRGRIVNTPYVDNSYKWAGGGLVSTVGDLLRFGNIMLYSLQADGSHVNDTHLPGFLKPETVKTIWKPVMKIASSDKFYAQGWVVVPEEQACGFCSKKPYIVEHTGGAMGASSILLMIPSKTRRESLPSGIVVAIMGNIGEVSFYKAGSEIALAFESLVEPLDRVQKEYRGSA